MEDNLTPKLYQFLSTVIEIMDAEKGNVQLYDKDSDSLKIVAQIGFNEEFLRTFKTVRLGHSGICSIAFQRRVRVIAEDTAKHRAFDSLGDTSKRFGFSAVQSTPLFDEFGKFFGIASTHFRHPHHPHPKELDLLDRYLSKAGPLIARKLHKTFVPDLRIRY